MSSATWLGVQGLCGFGFRVQGSGSLGFWLYGVRLRISGLGLRVLSFEFRSWIWSLEPRILSTSLNFRTNLPVCLGFIHGPLIWEILSPIYSPYIPL